MALIIGTAAIDNLTPSDTAASDTVKAKAGADIINYFLSTANNNLYGEAGDDTISGGNGNDLLSGGIGNDILNAGWGYSILNGGLGADHFNIVLSGSTVDIEDLGIGSDILTVDQNFVNATVVKAWKATNQTINDGGVVTLSTNGAAIDVSAAGGSSGFTLKVTGNSSKLIGSAQSDNLIGGVGHDYLDGNYGADTMEGGHGNDIYVIDSADDVVTELVNEGVDLINSSISFDLSTVSNIENLTLIGTFGISGSGNAEKNIIIGNGSANTLTGGDGIDTLIGGGGGDTFVVNITSVGTLEDTIVAGKGRDTIQVMGHYAGSVKVLKASANIEDIDISNTSDSLLNLRGNAHNNVLIGNDANE
jgi:Ca2+-binding RTX toxin-like protein